MHVDLHLDRHDPSKNRLVLDGIDFTKSVLIDGFSLGFQADASQPFIHFDLRPDTVTVTGDFAPNPAEPIEVTGL